MLTNAKVLVVSDLWLPFPGGAERYIFNLARDLYRRGFDVHVFTGYAEALQYDGPTVVYRIASTLRDREFVILRGEWQKWEIIKPASNITFMEPVVDMRDFYAQCRLMLVPSVSEDAGTVVQEATLNGLPCLVSDVGGLRETASGSILLDPRDRRIWRAAIIELDDPDYYREVVKRQRVTLSKLAHNTALDELAAAIKRLVQ